MSRPEFDAALAKIAEERGTLVLKGANCNLPNKSDRGWSLIVDFGGDQTLVSRFLVDATGLARSLSSHPKSYDKLVGLINFLRPSSKIHNVDNSLLLAGESTRLI